MKKFILFTLCLIGCDYYDMRLKINNKSRHEVFYLISKNDSINSSNPLNVYKNDTILEESSIILPNSISKEAMFGRNSWEYFVKEECEDRKIRVFLFEKKLILNTNWDSILKYQNYTKKITLSFEDLEKRDWEIIIDENKDQ